MADAEQFVASCLADIGVKGGERPYTDGFWCSRWTSHHLSKLGLGRYSNDSPMQQRRIFLDEGRVVAVGMRGSLAFIDLMGQAQQATHVMVVEQVQGSQVVCIGRRPQGTPDDVTRWTYTTGDGFLMDFGVPDWSKATPAPAPSSQPIARAAWGARYAPDKTVASTSRVAFMVHHTVNVSKNHPDCPVVLRQIEKDHHAKWGYSVGYNLVVCPHGSLYEGCGIGRRGQHCPDWNTKAVGVAYLGDGRQPIPDAAKATFQGAYAWLSDLWGRRLEVLGHRDKRQTECPGSVLYQWARSSLATTSPTPQPQPSPPVHFPGDAMTRHDFKITLDGEGRGYSDLPVPKAKLVSVVINGNNPQTSGWKRGFNEPEALAVGAVTRVVVKAEQAGAGAIDASAWVAD